MRQECARASPRGATTRPRLPRAPATAGQGVGPLAAVPARGGGRDGEWGCELPSPSFPCQYPV